MDLLKLLSEKIGLVFELFEVPDKKWGAYDKVSWQLYHVVLWAWSEGLSLMSILNQWSHTNGIQGKAQFNHIPS